MNSFVKMIGDTDIMERVDTQYIDKLFMDGEHLQLRPAAEFHALPPTHLRQWAFHKSRYTVVTTELVEWLRKAINGRSAIEIGAGHGDLGRHLGIPITDSYCHQLPEVRYLYASLGQIPVDPPADVERIEAMEAVKKYKPQVVIGSWITQKGTATEFNQGIYSSQFGPDHLEIMSSPSVECFIMIGNTRLHGDTYALRIPHRTFAPPWLISRARDQENNRIWMWGQ